MEFRMASNRQVMHYIMVPMCGIAAPWYRPVKMEKLQSREKYCCEKIYQTDIISEIDQAARNKVKKVWPWRVTG
jgi:hypothetical protein